jgi:hypothetical protein
MKALLLLVLLSASSLSAQVVVWTAAMNPLVGVRFFPDEAVARQAVPLEASLRASLCKNDCSPLATATLYGKLVVIRDMDPNTTHFEISYTVGDVPASILVRKTGPITQQQIWVQGASEFRVLPLRPAAPLMEPS